MKKFLLAFVLGICLICTSCVTPFGILLPGFEVDIPVAPGFNVSVDVNGPYIPIYPGYPRPNPPAPEPPLIRSNIIGIWKSASGDPYRSFEFYSNGVCRYDNYQLSIPRDVCWFDLNTRKHQVTLRLNNKDTVTYDYKVYGTNDRYLRLTSTRTGRVIELIRAQ